MTAAATLSTTLRRWRASRPASRIPRSAVTVVNRSSYISTGTPTTLASWRASVSADRAAGPLVPSSDNGSPTTTTSASSSRTSLAIAAWSWRRDDERCTVVSAEATVPEKSLTAMPMRLEPRSMPSARTPGTRLGTRSAVVLTLRRPPPRRSPELRAPAPPGSR